MNCHSANSLAEFFEVLREVFGEGPVVLEQLYNYGA